MRQYEEEKMLIGSDNKFIAWNYLVYYGRLCNKDNEDKDDTKIEQNLDKKEDAEDFNKKDEEADENKKVEEDEDEDENSREARVYYVDDITGEIMGKTITVKTEYDIWKALQGNGILTEVVSC